jgi:hypothetical protein
MVKHKRERTTETIKFTMMTEKQVSQWAQLFLDRRRTRQTITKHRLKHCSIDAASLEVDYDLLRLFSRRLTRTSDFD